MIKTLLLWIKYPVLRKYEWRQSKFLWGVKKYRRLIILSFKNYWYQKKRTVDRFISIYPFFNRITSSYPLYRRILRDSIPYFLISFFIVILFEISNYFIPTTIIPEGVVQFISPNFWSSVVIEPYIQIVIFAGYAQLSVILLGLFYAALSIVISKVYADVSEDVRLEILNEKTSASYSSIVVIFGGISIFLLSLTIIGYKVSIYNTVFATLLCLLSIFSFVKVGNRTFRYFNPEYIANYIIYEIKQYIVRVTPNCNRWDDASFQYEQWGNTETNLNTCVNILTIMSEKQHLNGEPINRIGYFLFDILNYYTSFKNEIPTDSYWYKRVGEFRDYLTAGDHEIDISVRTGTTRAPKGKPDFFWFEDIVCTCLKIILQTHLSNSDFISVNKLLDYARGSIKSMAYSYSVQEAIRLLKEIVKSITESSTEDTDTNQDIEKCLNEIAMFDFLGYLYVNTLLGFFESVKRESIIDCARTVSTIKWRKKESIYEKELPHDAVLQLEKLQKWITNEIKIEGRKITKEWYITQIATIGILKYAYGSLNTLMEVLAGDIYRLVTELKADGKFRKAADLARIGIESCSKLRSHLPEFEEHINKLNEFRYEVNIPWPTSDFKDIYSRVEKIREDYYLVLSEITPGLFELERDPKLPDYFGENYNFIVEECYSLVIKGKVEVYSKMFPILFRSSFVAYERLRKELEKSTPDTILVFIIQPILDLIDISGFSLLFAELDGNNIYDTTKSVWKFYLERIDEDMLKVILNLISYYSKPGLLQFKALDSGRELMRTGWHQKFDQILVERGIIVDRHFRYNPYDDNDTQVHESPIIRAISKGVSYDLDSAKAAFIGLFLIGYFEDADIEIPGYVVRFLEDYQNELENQ